LRANAQINTRIKTEEELTIRRTAQEQNTGWKSRGAEYDAKSGFGQDFFYISFG